MLIKCPHGHGGYCPVPAYATKSLPALLEVESSASGGL